MRVTVLRCRCGGDVVARDRGPSLVVVKLFEGGRDGLSSRRPETSSSAGGLILYGRYLTWLKSADVDSSCFVGDEEEEACGLGGCDDVCCCC